MEEDRRIVEKRIRDYILSKIPISSIIDYDVSISIRSNDDINADITVDIVTSPFIKCDLNEVVQEAIKVGREKLEELLRELRSETKRIREDSAEEPK